MKRKIISCLALVILLLLVAAQCSVPPTPEKIIETVEVEKEVIVTQEVVRTVEVEVPSGMDFSATTLNFIGWQGYEDPDAFQPLYDYTGMKLNATYPSNLEEVISLYQAGGAGSYDVGVGMNRYIMLMRALDIMEPLDESKLPNLEQMLPAFKKSDWWGRIDGKLYAVPAFVGFDTLCSNADQVAEPDWFFWQKEEYKGRYGVINNPLGSL